MTDIKSLVPKHGEKLVLDFTTARTRETFERVQKCRAHNEEYFGLLALQAMAQGDVLRIPCKLCFLDMALAYEEAAALLREVAGEKIQIPTSKHDGG